MPPVTPCTSSNYYKWQNQNKWLFIFYLNSQTQGLYFIDKLQINKTAKEI